MPEGVILKGIGGLYSILSDSKIYTCQPRGIFRKEGEKPLPGDNVTITVYNNIDKTGVIEKIHKRQSILKRPEVANVNQIIIVLAAKHPKPDFLLVDNLILSAKLHGIKIILCINKIDSAEQSIIEKIKDSYENTGVIINALSAKTGENVDILKNNLKGKISVMAGQSGTGKSTILNKVTGDMYMETGNMSKIKKGRHTTRHAEMICLDKRSFLVDTPGFSFFELDNVKPALLKDFYSEFKEYEDNCRFSDCIHIGESDCAVKNAAEKNLIDPGRYSRYKKIYESLKEKEKKRRGY